MESHLLQMRGLKLSIFCRKCVVNSSHLLQMRGLKPFEKIYIGCSTTSHLLQMRGLKQQIIGFGRTG